MLLKVIMTALLFNAVSFADMALSSVQNGAMPPIEYVPASQVISYYKKAQNQRKLTAQESETFNLISVAHDIFGVKEFEAVGFQQTLEDKAKSLQVFKIANSIQRAVEQKKSWDPPVSKKQLEQLQPVEPTIKSALGENSSTWAWIRYQRGEKKEAKSILTKGFESAYKEVMKLKRLPYREGSGPLQPSESLVKALTPMSTADENKDRESKLNEMRVHVSNLPDMMIMT